MLGVIFSAGVSSKFGDVSSVHFLEDIWLGDTSLAQQYPCLYNIVQWKNIMLPNMLTQTQLSIEGP
jgi:hypothetical protein